MTYRELFEWAACLTAEELEQEVMLYDTASDEYHPLVCLNFAAGKQDVERGHPVLMETES